MAPTAGVDVRLLDVRLAGTVMRLLPQRAAFLPEFSTLRVADAHSGKAVSFRRLGVPVPGGTTQETLHRLSAALDSTGAQHLVFLGDLLHSVRSKAADTVAAVSAWRTRHAGLVLTLVRGNHDGHAGDPPAAWDVQCVDGPLALGPFALAHHPEALPGVYVLAGHIHPAVRIHGRAHASLRMPCFHLGPAVGVLPAFGAFTGMHVMPRGPGDRVYAIADDAVLALPVST